MNEQRNNNLTAANAKGAESFTLRVTRIVTMNRRGLLPLRCLPPTRSGLEERAEDTKAIWNLVIGAFLGFGIWDLELFWDLGFGIWSFPRPVHGE